MVALLTSPLARAMDRLSGSEWMRRNGTLVMARRSRVPITGPPTVSRWGGTASWRSDHVPATGGTAFSTYIPKVLRYQNITYAMSRCARVPMMLGLLGGEA